MDTRTKIVSYEAAVKAAAGKQVRWVTGHFDPLLAGHVRQLRQYATPDHELVVIVTNSEAPLLPQQARAELVAALAEVAYVVMKEGPARSDVDDERITREFVNLIVGKHREAAL